MNLFRRNSGFTLIELMVVIAGVAILAAIAYPSYSEYIMKGRRSDAKSALMSLQMAQEKFRANCIQYATTIGAASDCATNTVQALGITQSGGNYFSADGHYAVSITAADATTYSLRAARVVGGKQANDKCGDYQINQNGTKSVINATYADTSGCW